MLKEALVKQMMFKRWANAITFRTVAELWDRQQSMDDWWVAAAEGCMEADLKEVINFTFVGGGSGIMSRGDIFLHIVNHGNYHRGFVGDMLYHAGVTPLATDFTVFLRDT